MRDSPPAPERPIFEAGPFDVLRPVARGGMAEVWLGRHRVHHTEAAIKIVRSADDGAGLDRRLRVEVRAMAGLDHPRVATVLDTGTLDACAEADSGGRVSAGSPWLAMTWVPHGDLGRVEGPQPWAVTRALLLDILEALAHAHARGVIHRDLKPGNVLLRVEGEAGVRAVLTDFGIAQVLDPHGDEPTLDQRISGTPEYMAPEQIRGEWRDVGPWTDLYALGCLGWRLATGEPPFIGRHPVRISMKHLGEPAPPLALPPDHPPAFERWLRRLLAKDPHARYERAADAASALAGDTPEDPAGTGPLFRALTHGPLAAAPPSLVEGPTRAPGADRASHLALVFGATADDAVACAATRALSASDTASDDPPIAPPPDAGADAPGPARSSTGPIQPLPDDWRSALMSQRGVVGRAGPGLFGLRPLPMVGRIAARDGLWDALRQAWRDGTPRMCVVQSAAGFGRRRLADWLTRRADELGAAYVIHATHGPIPARRDGLGAALLEWYRALDADARLLDERIDAELARRAPEVDPIVRRDTRDALAALARRGLLVERPGQHDPQARGFVRWLRWLARRRPIILRLDNAHWSTASLSIAARLARETGLPLLILLTLPIATERAHVGAERLAALERLEAQGGHADIRLAPLDAAEMLTLLVDGVGLAPGTARPLVEAAGGNPLFAVQVVAEWLADGALRPGSRGMVPVGRVKLPIPADQDALGRARIERVLHTSGVDPDIGWRALEAAAMLGEAVAADDWASVTGADGEALSDLTLALLDSGLARPADDGWSFAHRFIREALVGRARAGGRARRLALFCALAAIDTEPDDARAAERRARYLHDGGHRLEAVEAYAEAARRTLARGAYRAAATLLDTADAVFAAAGLLPTDVRRARLLAMRAEAARFTGQPDLAEAALASLRRMPHPPGRPWARAELSRLDGQQAFYAGRTDAALAAWRAAVDLFEQAGDPEGVARSLHGQGWALCSIGETLAAHALFERGLGLATAADLRLQAAWCAHGMAVTRIWSGRPGGRPLAEDAAARFAELGQPAGRGLCLVHLADALWADGEAIAARAALDRAVGLLRAAEAATLPDALTRRAILALEEGRLDAARADSTEVEGRWLDVQLAGRRCEPLIVLACLELAADRPPTAARLFDRAAAHADTALFASPALGRILERAAEGLTPHDRPRARRAFELARRVWRPLDPRRGALLGRRIREMQRADARG